MIANTWCLRVAKFLLFPSVLCKLKSMLPVFCLRVCRPLPFRVILVSFQLHVHLLGSRRRPKASVNFARTSAVPNGSTFPRISSGSCMLRILLFFDSFRVLGISSDVKGQGMPLSTEAVIAFDMISS
ncbi:hypothetical protein KC19_4G248900 [Ceratodon purpureus]|uniref:Secreted protein n=1 Tax=Ceratodon purpureus TaxID=3225 RepID=A0A8T0IEU7_CERPU|nr:hypothetical protein KC19_4G248900 [Ceratodon purpureus]